MAVGLNQLAGYGNAHAYDEYAREQQYRNEMMARQMMGLQNAPQTQTAIKELETKPNVKLLLLGD